METYQFKKDTLSVWVCPSSKTLAQTAAESVEEYLHPIFSKQQTATLVLATGNSQLEFLAHLVAREQIDWSRIILFHLDEYLGISADSPASFRYYLQENLIKHISPKHFYGIEAEALEPLAECERYSQLLKQHPIDLCFLGIGSNGHLAFNEPGVANFKDPYPVKLVKLAEKTRLTQVEQGHFSHLDTVPQYAYTLTLSTILTANKIICLASGTTKAPIVKQMLTDTITPACPASGLRFHPNTTLFLDGEAAIQLEGNLA
ncbi:glucosamine/galactosamine-6-phosphate isomerase [Gloeothece citriformis PCC 7424]|uniref:Glucosamine/galactosamine-6-phosphate isomerase n=1 Tax=Gloeothece citriformis (strain PCC 7424) TaxID=65393 RepID=B7KIA5_GLOC7|nr:glucosamine-6-phosphate deaminase [Gloeothece citriformis]ACK73592.1 glucosamine/galactosamine-6-phosphate isomerase [Gloeothece citriformis PCC 7424]